MSAQHTPGPWRLNAGNEIEVMAHNRSVASAACGGLSGIRLIEAEGNARLIAAAPDMLAALQELHLKAIIGTDDERHAALNKAWAAIAKAAGA